jgi:hypothetical protein
MSLLIVAVSILELWLENNGHYAPTVVHQTVELVSQLEIVSINGRDLEPISLLVCRHVQMLMLSGKLRKGGGDGSDVHIGGSHSACRFIERRLLHHGRDARNFYGCESIHWIGLGLHRRDL